MSKDVPTAEIFSPVTTTDNETATQSNAFSPSVQPVVLLNAEKDLLNWIFDDLVVFLYI